MFSLNQIAPLVKKRKRVGRGGSRGGTSGKGHKGQKARSGGSPRPGFEGGQMPIYRRLPKHGFTNAPFKRVVEIVNFTQLTSFDDGAEITRELLMEQGIIKPRKNKPFLLKVLGNGLLEKKLTIIADLFSAKALEAIEKTGGKAIIKKG